MWRHENVTKKHKPSHILHWALFLGQGFHKICDKSREKFPTKRLWKYTTLLWAHAMVPVEMIVVMILSTPLRMARAHLSTSLCRARPAKREREGERNIHFWDWIHTLPCHRLKSATILCCPVSVRSLRTQTTFPWTRKVLGTHIHRVLLLLSPIKEPFPRRLR